ncbi:hypothetical protein ACHQM5_012170 [Ranunculus cassubicifolius]
MDAYEATRIVFSRIQSLDPENASKIMGLLLIQDHGEKEMIRLAFGPEALLHSVILKARRDLGLGGGGGGGAPLSPSTPSSPSPFFNSPMPISRQNSSSRMLSNLSPASSAWAPPSSTYSDVQNYDELANLTSQTATAPINTTTSASYAAVVAAMNGFNNTSNNNNMASVGSSTTTPSELIIDDFQLQDQLSFLDGPKNSDLFYPTPPQASDLSSSPSNSSDSMLFPPYWGGGGGGAASPLSNGNHRRSCSVSDMCLGSSDPLGSSLGWKPCLYFARGYCKNGTSCRFLHGFPDSPDSNSLVGSPSKLDVMEQCQELLLLRSKNQQQQQQQQLRSQLLASSTFPYSPTGANSKAMNFLLQQQQNDTQRAAMLLGEDAHKFSPRSRIDRSDYLNSLGGMVMNPGSRQIYLTFPADSTFREEDVSNYFSIYGPVQDVRIPYQQKRMFGFVTFVYPETVKLILAKGNPHFVCDARVLVKPYKEKGKVPDKKQQQMERGEFSACTTPTGLDSRDPFDLQLGGRMFNSTQDMLLRRKLEEQVELQQAIELQSRRFMGLQLLDIKNHHHQRNLSSPSPTNPFSPHMNHSPFHHHSSSFDGTGSSPESNEDNCMSPSIGDNHRVKVNVDKEETSNDCNGNGDGSGNGSSNGSPKLDETDFPNGLEHNLPDSPFASPTKSDSSSSVINNNLLSAAPFLPASSLDMASFKSCYFQIPRFSSDHGAIGM